MRKTHGFTVIELVIVIAFLLTAAVVLFIQISNIRAENDNEKRRTAINAVYFSLEEDFYKKHKYYPEKITDKTLPTMDPELLKDSKDIMIGEIGSNYVYESRDCQDGKCKSYTLRTILQNEAEYIKTSRNS